MVSILINGIGGVMDSPLWNQGFCLWFTGFSGAGKSTIAAGLSRLLYGMGVNHDILDGDEIRTHLSKGLGFSKEDRFENIARVSWVASRIVKHGGIVITSCISPYREMRQKARKLISNHGRFIEVFVDTPLKECISRDPKGLYKKALNNEIKNFTGISDPYEPPENPEIVLKTLNTTPSDCANQIISYLFKERIFLRDAKRQIYIGKWLNPTSSHFNLIKQELDSGTPIGIGIEGSGNSIQKTYKIITKKFPNEDIYIFKMPKGQYSALSESKYFAGEVEKVSVDVRNELLSKKDNADLHHTNNIKR